MPEGEELAKVPEGICRDTFLRQRMTRSVVTVAKPLPHATLGLQRYAQATSPIRRFSDMLVHWQIKACLRGEAAPIDVAVMSELTDKLQDRSREVNKLDKDINKYWLCYFFNKQLRENSNRSYAVMLVGWIRQETGFANVIFQDFGLELAVSLQRPVNLGEKLRLICTRADILTSELKFEESQDMDVGVHVLPLQSAESDASEASVQTEDKSLMEKV